MKHFKFIALLSAFVLISAVAWAGNIPEYDAVDTDADNFFADTNLIYEAVTAFNPIQGDSDFRREDFDTNAGQSKLSPCWGAFGVEAALTDVWNQGTYTWDIVLQMKPESDINLNIYDCVLKHNETDLFRYADQTGRYRQPWGELIFNPLYSPQVAAVAIAGPFATNGGWPDQLLDARTLPGLVPIALNFVSYTSKAHWPEGIVIAMPKTGRTNSSGQMEYNLKQGDLIRVTVEIPSDTNTVDVWYGIDSVLLKYIGIINTELLASIDPE